MEYQKISNLFENPNNQSSKFWTENWMKVNDDAPGKYSTNSQVKIKTTMLKSSLCGYSDAYMLVKGTIAITGAGVDATVRNMGKRNGQVIFKNCAPFADCIYKRSNAQVDNARDLDVVMPT